MKPQNIIFMDIDGTLIIRDHIPLSAIKSIQKTRAKGNLVYLCTGRSLAEIGDIKNIGFDGIIGGGGCYIESHDTIVDHFTFNLKDIEFLKSYLDEHQVHYYLECNDGIYCHQSVKDFMIKEIFHGETSSFLDLLNPIEKCSLENVNKISFISPFYPYQEIAKELDKYHLVKASWGPNLQEAGEISLEGVNKAAAIKKLLKYLKLDSIKTYAFGDSMNDVEMFESVDVAIAMGNYSHGIEKYADFITKDALDDGIAFAMKKYELI